MRRYLRHFPISAKHVGELHPPRGLAFGFEHPRVCYQNADAAGARGGDIETVGAVKKFHSGVRLLKSASEKAF